MAKIIKKNKNLLLFIALIILAGVLHVVVHGMERFESTVLFCVESSIYIGLILAWGWSVNRRLLPSRAKTYMIIATALMLFFYIIRSAKYRIVMPELERFCWYTYYIPILFIPTLFLMSCMRLQRFSKNEKGKEALLLIPAGLLAIAILLNDLHYQAFLPNPGVEILTGSDNTYTKGILFYAAYAWAGIMLVAGVIFLIIASRRALKWKKVVFPLIAIVLIPALTRINDTVFLDSFFKAYQLAEMLIFCFIGLFEICIRNRMIPSNENHIGFFENMSLPVLITEKSFTPAYQTKTHIPADQEQLKMAVQNPIYLDRDTCLSGMGLEAGFAFYTEDESSLNRLNDELRDANEVLAMENEVLARERELMEEQAGIEERSLLYSKAAKEVYPVQKRISDILSGARPGTEGFRATIAKALVLTAYVKRKANFVLVEAERDTVSSGELSSALEESVHYLQYQGISASVDTVAGRDFSCREAMDAYDCFEAAIEGLSGKTSDIWVRLSDEELLIMAEFEGDLKLQSSSLPIRQSNEDGQLMLRIALGGCVA